MKIRNLKDLFVYIIFTVFFIILSSSLAYAQQTITIGTETKILKPYSAFAVTTDETARCLNCHATRMPKLVENWEHSSHAKNGVGCYECHKAEKGDQTAKLGHFSFNVQLVVSPARCGFCHQEQYQEFAVSGHATAFDSIKYLPMRKSNPELFETSCVTCHGTEVKMKKGKAVDNSWPNIGIGRINPDGSIGNCASCHGYHNDSLAKARDFSTCVKCHKTDFSPAFQAWKMSAHGQKSGNTSEEVDFAKKHLNLSEDGILKPNCQTCHVQASTKDTKATHDISSRLSWNLSDLKAKHTEDWGTKRLQMQKTCRNCHASSQVDQYYRRLDAAVVSTNHIIDKKITSNTPIWEQISLRNSIMAFRVGVAMLGSVDPLGIESLTH